MENFLQVIIPTIVVGVLGWGVGRFSIKTKTQVKTENLEQRVTEIEDAMPVMMKCHLAQLLALKHGKVNGECDDALDNLNAYLIRK